MMRFLSSGLLFLLVCSALRAQKAEIVPPGRDLTPLLPYIFFDSGSAVIPDRYVQFTSPSETGQFSDTTIEGDALAQHRRILNIIGYRMRKHPATTIAISAHDSQQPEIGETRFTSVKRAEVVRDYLVEIWRIDSSRIHLLPSGGWPKYPSNKKDPRGIIENRRAEITSNDWEILRPIWRPRASTGRGPTFDLYRFILFNFDSPEAGPLNERAFREYLYPNITQDACITVTGIIDEYLRELQSCQCNRLDQNRAGTVTKGIRKNVNNGLIASLTDASHEPDAPSISNTLPEGRFYGRGVIVKVER